MKKNRLYLPVCAAVLSLFIAGGIRYAAAQSNGHKGMQMGQQLKIGKGVEFDFSQPQKIGDVLLPEGSYRLVHRTTGQEHIVEFMKLDSGRVLARINCQIEPLAAKVSRTEISAIDDAGTPRIVRIEIAGENVAHVI
ncbi:MAG: hypothetical protein JST28_19540 [Acidobacteria bacterium]|nr:hypothetical protein [Acidobacteriota bacterium]